MLNLKYRRSKEKAEADRQLVIAYKSFFNTEYGKIVFSDLANKYFLLNPLPLDPTLRDRAEGARSVVLQILTKVQANLADLEAILNGDFKSITEVERKDG